MRSIHFVFVIVASLISAGPAGAAAVVRSAVTTGGAGDAAFNTVINAFRADLGGTLNAPGPCSPGPCTSGRREIN
ncbi:MAG: hypothetical protein EXR86_13460 [Gammaproteobacteria bacterium]|nr:hypothetical protein [Gammaproteobacteria bacterium]